MTNYINVATIHIGGEVYFRDHMLLATIALMTGINSTTDPRQLDLLKRMLCEVEILTAQNMERIVQIAITPTRFIPEYVSNDVCNAITSMHKQIVKMDAEIIEASGDYVQIARLLVNKGFIYRNMAVYVGRDDAGVDIVSGVSQ